jgi:plasmid stabilization system protein ParE
MSAKCIEYHQGAIADVKSAVAWYQKRRPKAALDFIEELHRAADTIREAPERWRRGQGAAESRIPSHFAQRSTRSNLHA